MRALEIIWEIFLCSFSFLFQIILFEASGRCFWDVRTVILNVRTVFLVVRTIRLIRPDVHSSCLDECVFATSTWHFRLDGEPCRVKLHSPCAVAHFFAPFGSFLSSCALSLCFLCVSLWCTCHLCSLSPPHVFFLLFYYFILSFYA
jgi:hypothetical protein